MRRIFTSLIFTVLFNVSLKAQNSFRFANSSAIWNEYELYFWFPSGSDEVTGTYSIQKDTFFNNLDYQKIILGHFGSSASFVRRDSTNKIFVYEDYLPERLVFDFSLNEGDTFKIPKGLSFSDTIRLIVDSTDTVIYGTPRKRMFMTCDSSYNHDCFIAQNDIWISGIGSLSSYFLSPYFYEYMPEGSNYSLLCYQENGITYNFSTTCFVGIKDIPKDEISGIISISPNPATDILNISLHNTRNSLQSISITNLSGKQLLQTTQTEIPISHLARGLYFVKVDFTNGQSEVGKVVIR